MKYDGDFAVQTTDGVGRYPQAEDYSIAFNDESPSLLSVYEKPLDEIPRGERGDEKIAAFNLDYVISYGFEEGDDE